MARLNPLAVLALLAAWPARAQAAAIDRWAAEIDEASARFGIPRQWIRQVMRLESGGRTSLDGRPITSRAGAMGLMQLMPATWVEMRTAYGLGDDPYDPRDNVLAGAGYLRAMYERFGYPGMFAAYNAGPARYAAHLRSGRALPAETVAYLARITTAPLRSPRLRVAIARPAKRGSVPRRPTPSSLPDDGRVAIVAEDGEGLFAIRR